MTETVALIGVGAMGSALLDRLRRVGKTVRAFDISEAGRRASEDAGAFLASSPADAARGAAFIHVFVRTDAEARAVTCDKDGVLDTIREGAFILLNSTILPSTTKEIAFAAIARGGQVLDAPMTSVPSRVREGKGAFLLGGSIEQVSIVREYLATFGCESYHFGPLGAGNVAKLARNMVNAAERTVLFEALKIAGSQSVDLRLFLQMMRDEDQAPLASQWEKAIDLEGNEPSLKPGANLFTKDLPLAGDFVRSIGMTAPIVEAALAVSSLCRKS